MGNSNNYFALDFEFDGSYGDLHDHIGRQIIELKINGQPKIDDSNKDLNLGRQCILFYNTEISGNNDAADRISTDSSPWSREFDERDYVAFIPNLNAISNYLFLHWEFDVDGFWNENENNAIYYTIPADDSVEVETISATAVFQEKQKYEIKIKFKGFTANGTNDDSILPREESDRIGQINYILDSNVNVNKNADVFEDGYYSNEQFVYGNNVISLGYVHKGNSLELSHIGNNSDNSFEFIGWQYGDNNETDSAITIDNITSAKTITAKFRKKPLITLEFSPSNITENGLIQYRVNNAGRIFDYTQPFYVNSNSSIEFFCNNQKITIDSNNYTFDSFKDGENKLENNTLSEVTTDKTIIVLFNENPRITINKSICYRLVDNYYHYTEENVRPLNLKYKIESGSSPQEYSDPFQVDFGSNITVSNGGISDNHYNIVGWIYQIGTITNGEYQSGITTSNTENLVINSIQENKYIGLCVSPKNYYSLTINYVNSVDSVSPSQMFSSFKYKKNDDQYSDVNFNANSFTISGLYDIDIVNLQISLSNSAVYVYDINNVTNIEKRQNGNEITLSNISGNASINVQISRNSNNATISISIDPEEFSDNVSLYYSIGESNNSQSLTSPITVSKNANLHFTFDASNLPSTHEFNKWEVVSGSIDIQNENSPRLDITHISSNDVAIKAKFKEKPILTIDFNGSATFNYSVTNTNSPSLYAGNTHISSNLKVYLKCISAPSGKIFNRFEFQNGVSLTSESNGWWSFTITENATIVPIFNDNRIPVNFIPINVTLISLRNGNDISETITSEKLYNFDGSTVIDISAQINETNTTWNKWLYYKGIKTCQNNNYISDPSRTFENKIIKLLGEPDTTFDEQDIIQQKILAPSTFIAIAENKQECTINITENTCCRIYINGHEYNSSETYYVGSRITLTAELSSDCSAYIFKGWTINGVKYSSNEPDYELIYEIRTSILNISISFQEPENNVYNITVQSLHSKVTLTHDNVPITIDNNIETFSIENDAITSVSFKLDEIAEGYSFDKFLIDNVVRQYNENSLRDGIDIVIDGDKTIALECQKQKKSISFSNLDNCKVKITINGSSSYVNANQSINVEYGTSVTFKCEPNDGYTFSKWKYLKVNSSTQTSNSTNPMTFAVKDDYSITCECSSVQQQHSVTIKYTDIDNTEQAYQLNDLYYESQSVQISFNYDIVIKNIVKIEFKDTGENLISSCQLQENTEDPIFEWNDNGYYQANDPKVLKFYSSHQFNQDTNTLEFDMPDLDVIIYIQNNPNIYDNGVQHFYKFRIQYKNNPNSIIELFWSPIIYSTV